MVHFASSSLFFHEYPLPEVFDYMEEAGLDAMEFWVETPSFWLAGRPEDDLARCIAAHPGIGTINVHAPVLDLNPLSINPRVAAASVQYAVEAVGMAERIGAEVITLHPGRRTAKRVPGGPEFRRLSRYLGTLREASRGKRVRLALENMEKKVNFLLCSPEEMRELLDREPWLRFTLDVSHAMGTSIAEVNRYIDLCFHRLVNVHMSRASDGTMHLPIAGSDEMAGILHTLRDYGYEGTITLEIEDRNFPQELSSEEKILLLSGEVAFLRKYLE